MASWGLFPASGAYFSKEYLTLVLRKTPKQKVAITRT